MTKTFLFLAGLVFSAVTVASAADPATAEKELLALQGRWAEARQARDVAFLDSFYAPEFRVTAMNGRTYGRTEDLAMFSSGDLKPELIENDEMKVSLYGDVGLVTGREHLKGSYKGHTGEFSLRFSNLYVKRDGRWQLVNHHATEIPARKPATNPATK